MNYIFFLISIILLNGCSNHFSAVINHPITPNYLLLNKKATIINEVLLLDYCYDLIHIESEEKYVDFIKSNKFGIKTNEDFLYMPKRFYSDSMIIKGIMYHINNINEFDYEYIGFSMLQNKDDNEYYIYFVFQSTFLNCLFTKNCLKSIEFIYKDGEYYFNGIDFHPKPENTRSSSH